LFSSALFGGVQEMWESLHFALAEALQKVEHRLHGLRCQNNYQSDTPNM
jgi:hypothetical protein